MSYTIRPLNASTWDGRIPAIDATRWVFRSVSEPGGLCRLVGIRRVGLPLQDVEVCRAGELSFGVGRGGVGPSTGWVAV